MISKIVTITGASGSGKTSVARELLKIIPSAKLVLSITTRPPRESDLPDEYRTNVPLAEFEKRSQNNEFLWEVEAHGNRYGTLRASVNEALANPYPSLMILIPNVLATLRSEER